MNLVELFSEHPNSVGETYARHFASASTFAFKMGVGALVCFVHGVLPFLFKQSGSNLICELHERMVTARRGSVVDAIAREDSP